MPSSSVILYIISHSHITLWNTISHDFSWAFWSSHYNPKRSIPKLWEEIFYCGIWSNLNERIILIPFTILCLARQIWQSSMLISCPKLFDYFYKMTDGTKVAKVEVNISLYVWQILQHMNAVSLLWLNNANCCISIWILYHSQENKVLVTDGNDWYLSSNKGKSQFYC